MNKKYLMCFVLAASISVFAQGRGHGGGAMGGRPSGVGPMGAPSDHSMSRDTRATGSAGNTHAGSKSPEQMLTQNSKLSSKLDSMLPNGTTSQQACSGFKNLGQCVAAIHVSNNLKIPFDDLKAKMTGDNAESLGKSIHDLKPDADAKTEAAKATKQAKKDISETKS
jgi:hypothetical protein